MIIACNWKMNLNGEKARHLVDEMAILPVNDLVQRIVFPPFPYLYQICDTLDESGILIGGQDCHVENSGAFTGDVSASMLADVGCDWVIIGHSERRHAHGEDNALIANKIRSAQSAGLSVMLCVGETESDRLSGNSETVVLDMLKSSLPDHYDPLLLAIAYEPVWAIGKGQTAGNDDIALMHMNIRTFFNEAGIANIPILYGGSVKMDNASILMGIDNVDGLLIGGASLDAGSINHIIMQAENLLN